MIRNYASSRLSGRATLLGPPDRRENLLACHTGLHTRHVERWFG
jgi:hypothetical protein